MGVIKTESCREGLSEKKAYEPPRAMRLVEMRSGAGACDASGSGDFQCFGNGNSAIAACDFSGNNGV